MKKLEQQSRIRMRYYKYIMTHEWKTIPFIKNCVPIYTATIADKGVQRNSTHYFSDAFDNVKKNLKVNCYLLHYNLR